MVIREHFIRIFGVSIAWLLFLGASAMPADVSLAWDPSPSANISAYRIYLGNHPGTYHATVTIGNQTSYRLAGLTDGTWYFAVTAFDTDRNESDFSNEVSQFIATPSQDMVAPNISGVSSSDITSARAIITWITDQPSDTQVDYGTTANYESSTPLSTILVQPHSRILTGLAANTLYHYQVKSRDAAGNLTVSGDYTFTTNPQGQSTPVITNVSVSNITNNSAVASWITNQPSNSELEYWLDGGDVEKAALDAFGIEHTLTLSNLKKQTRYYLRAKSLDSEGNQAVSSIASFTTLANGISIFVFPRFAGGPIPNESNNEILTGIALTNMSPDSAAFTVTAIDIAGNPITGNDVVNPCSLRLDAGAQYATLDTELFGNGLQNINSIGWVKIETSTPNTGGLFLTFDGRLEFLDGTALGETPLMDFAFTEIDEWGSTKIDIANDNAHEAIVTFDLIKADGTIRSSQSRTIPRNGALVADLYGDLFAETNPGITDYIRMHSTEKVHSFELMKRETGDVASLTGKDITVGDTTLYSPQYVLGGPYTTNLTIINLDARAGTVQLELLGEDGMQIGTTRILEIPANGKLHIDDPKFFYQPDLNDALIAGYVKIVSDGVRIAGSTIFEGSGSKLFSSALPLVGKLQNSITYSHIASNDMYFTGIAIANPHASDAYPVIEVHAKDGTLIDSKIERIPAGQKKTGLLTQFFSSLQGKDQTSGYIRIESDQPLASFALFGTNDLSVVSAIPPQIIQ